MVDSALFTGKSFSGMTDVTNYGQIKFMRIPQGWREEPPEPGGVGFKSLRTFNASENTDVKINIYYRGLPVSENCSKVLRELLASGPGIVYINTGMQPTPSEVCRIKELGEVLGTASNNQVVNNEKGWRGPCFQLNRAEVLRWNEKTLLAVQGWYQDPEENRSLHEFFGFFIDADPDADECPVEEIFFQAPDAKSYACHLADYQRALASIHWK